MKQTETFFKTKKRYVAIMVLCFLYGGFSLLLFVTEAYTRFWRTEIVNEPIPNPRLMDANRFSDSDFNRGLPPFRFPHDPVALLTSPTSLSYLLAGILCIVAGLAIWNLIREKESKKIKQETANHLLLPEERLVIDALKSLGLEATQSRLTKETGLNRVQVHRTINRLEAKGVVEKHKYGLTNKILLKKGIFE